MNATVPEETKRVIPFDAEELMSLAVRLAGNKAFGMCRGKFNERVSYLVERLIEKSGSPTDAIGKFDQLMGAIRVMAKMLARLERDGKTLARKELECALADPNYIIAGESVPLEKTLPVTILMFEPEKTLGLIKWTLDASLMLESIDELLPTRKEHRKVCDPQRLAWGTDILLAYKDILTGLPSMFEGSIRLTHAERPKLRRAENEKDAIFFSLSNQQTILAYMFFGVDQGNVLARVGRDNLNRVATWQINVPSFMLGWSPKFSIGFHEESVHAAWAKRYPTFTSKGVSHGYGAFFLMEPIMNHDARVDYQNGEMVRVDKKDGTYYRDIVPKKESGARIELKPFNSREVRFKI